MLRAAEEARGRLRGMRRELRELVSRARDTGDPVLWDRIVSLRDELRAQEIEEAPREGYRRDVVQLLDHYYRDAGTAVAEPPPTPKAVRRRGARGPGMGGASCRSRNIFDFEAVGGEGPASAPDPPPDGGSRKEVVSRFLAIVDGRVETPESSGAEPALGRQCPECGGDWSLQSHLSMMVCPACGCSQVLIMESMVPDASAEVFSDTTGLTYQRSTHLDQWLSNLQGNSTEVDPAVIAEVTRQVESEGVPRDKLTSQKVREILKRIGHSKQYDSVPAILAQLTGKEPPRLTPELTERLHAMFRQIQAPFARFANEVVPARKNFLSYAYVLRALLTICGRTDLVQHFRLTRVLKSREKLHVQDQIFKRICEHLGWPFTPVV